MTPEEWSARIGALAQVKQRILDLDPDDPLTLRAPHVGAQATTLVQCVADLGHPLDDEHATLLSQADGWPELNLAQHLLSTGQLTRGPLVDEARRRLREYVLPAAWSAADVYPVAVSDEDLDVIAVAAPGTAHAGQVAWLAGSVVDVYPTLAAWFDTVLELHLAELERLLAT